MQRSVILGVGHALPERIVTNHDFAQTLDTSDTWIQERTGIKERHFIADDQWNSEIAIDAARKALEHSQTDVKNLHYILVATSTPDHCFPPLAARVHDHLKASDNTAAFDINVACSGFVYALHVADCLLRSQPEGSTALVIASETLTRLLDMNDRNTAVLFGDGAGAVVLQTTQNSTKGILCSQLKTKGHGYQAMYAKGGAGAPHKSESRAMIMNGREIFKHAVLSMSEILQDLMAQTRLSLEQIKFIIPHQANKRILDAVARQCHLPSEIMVYTGDRHGNTGAASIPLALSQTWHQGKIGPGDYGIFLSFAAGFSWGGNVVRL